MYICLAKEFLNVSDSAAGHLTSSRTWFWREL